MRILNVGNDYNLALRLKAVKAEKEVKNGNSPESAEKTPASTGVDGQAEEKTSLVGGKKKPSKKEGSEEKAD